MAAVSVFVDDAIRGQLPDVCVRTGQPADMVVRTTRPVGGVSFGALTVLLMLFGPPGWLALIILALVLPGTEQLTVHLPYTRSAWNRERQQRHVRLGLAGVGLVALALALALALLHPGSLPLLWVVVGAVSLSAAGVLCFVTARHETGIYLDGSRRWVTLTRVHPAFAQAAERHGAASTRA